MFTFINLVSLKLATQFSFGKLPILKLNNEYKAGFWKAWYRGFKLSMKNISLSLETERVDGSEFRLFKHRIKTLALLHAIRAALG